MKDDSKVDKKKYGQERLSAKNSKNYIMYRRNDECRKEEEILINSESKKKTRVNNKMNYIKGN